MRNLMVKLWSDDAGVVTIEYLVLGTFLALGLIVGVNALEHAIKAELIELGNAILSFNQSYSVCGESACCATKTGSAAVDTNGLITLSQGPAGTPSQIDVNACP